MYKYDIYPKLLVLFGGPSNRQQSCDAFLTLYFPTFHRASAHLTVSQHSCLSGQVGQGHLQN